MLHKSATLQSVGVWGVSHKTATQTHTHARHTLLSSTGAVSLAEAYGYRIGSIKVQCRIEEGCGDPTKPESSITIACELGRLYSDGRHSLRPIGDMGDSGEFGDLGDWGAWGPRALTFWFGQVLLCCWCHTPALVFFDVRPHLVHLVELFAGMCTVTRVDQF